jgi:hypothetical protein
VASVLFGPVDWFLFSAQLSFFLVLMRVLAPVLHKAAPLFRFSFGLCSLAVLLRSDLNFHLLGFSTVGRARFLQLSFHLHGDQIARSVPDS